MPRSPSGNFAVNDSMILLDKAMDELAKIAMNRELVSVIMPCFNASAFVEQAVRSAFRQDYGNVELIVVPTFHCTFCWPGLSPPGTTTLT